MRQQKGPKHKPTKLDNYDYVMKVWGHVEDILFNLSN